MYKKSKSVKLQLKHLNDCYIIFENYAINQNIAEENKPQFINLMLRNYIVSSEVISDEDILTYKEKETCE